MESVEYGREMEEMGIVELPYCAGSDYSGDSVTLSNYEVLKKEFKDTPGVYEIWGDHGTYGIGYKKEECSPETLERIKEILAGLESYPLINEDTHSEVEMEIYLEAWKEASFHDIFPDYMSGYPEVMLEIIKEELFGKLEFGDHAIIETGCLVYFRKERIAELLEEDYPPPVLVYRDSEFEVSLSNFVFIVNGSSIFKKNGNLIMGENSSMRDFFNLPAEIQAIFGKWERGEL